MGAVHHTQHTREVVIAEFRRTGRVDLACAKAGCDRTMHYEWLRKLPSYKKDFEVAREEVAGLLEDEAVRRAYQGTQRPMAVNGNTVVITEFSDRLLEFLLKCRNRPVFGDRLGLHDGDGNALFAVPAVREYMKAAPDSE